MRIKFYCFYNQSNWSCPMRVAVELLREKLGRRQENGDKTANAENDAKTIKKETGK